MARVDLLDDRLVIRNEGLRRLLTIVGSITVRYEAVASLDVGLDAVPRWSTWRVGYNPAVGVRRAGIFWWRDERWFLDVSDLERTLVLRVKPGGAAYDAIAVTVDDPATLADELRARAGL